MLGILDPRGPIALAEHNLIITAFLIMLIIVVPVLILLYAFAWKYRAGNKHATYDPDQSHRGFVEIILWVLPASIILVLSIINWRSTHALDPSKPIISENKPLTIQVVALDWKWLFIYPEQGIATVNFIEFPKRTPLHFELTADAPMNLFWIPQLGGEMGAMQGMVNQLNLMASEPGEFVGKNAEINGQGYSGMTFIAKSTSKEDFDAWVASVQQSSNPLSNEVYDMLAKPSENVPSSTYSAVDAGLYGSIIMKFMPSSTDAMPGMDISQGMKM